MISRKNKTFGLEKKAIIISEPFVYKWILLSGLINVGGSIVSIKRSQVIHFSKYFFSLKIVFVLAYSVDPGECSISSGSSLFAKVHI